MVMAAVAAVAAVAAAAAAQPASPIVITWGSYPVLPGQTVLLTGSGFPCQPNVGRVLIKGINSGGVASATLIVGQTSRHSLKFVLPTSLAMDVFEVTVLAPGLTGGVSSKPYYLNAPDVWTVQGDLGNSSTPGGTVRLIGRGLGAAQARSAESAERQREALLTAELAQAVKHGRRSEARRLSTELQHLLHADADRSVPAGAATILRLTPVVGGAAPVELTAHCTDAEFAQIGDFSARVLFGIMLDLIFRPPSPLCGGG